MPERSTSFALIAEGLCWECRRPLDRVLLFPGQEYGECPPCGRRFALAGRNVVEQIAVAHGALDPGPVARVCLDDGTEIRPLGDGRTYVVPAEGAWIHTEWSL